MMISSLARRGFEATVGNGKQEMELNIPAWGIILLSLTAAGFFFVMFMIEYTFGRLIPALIAIESPQENITFASLPQDDPDAINKSPEPASARPAPITSSFRKTLRHLHSIGGFRARFRGLSVFIVSTVLIQWIAGMISVLPFLNVLGQGFAAILASVALAQFSLLWTTIVISEPSPKTWFRRFPSIKLWKKVAAPTAAFAVAEQVAIWIPMSIAIACGVGADKDTLANMTQHEKTVMAVGGTGAFILGLILAVVLVIPAFVVLTRVQASLLSDAEETIVPFDRSFGGKFVPEVVGGRGVVSMRDAWTTFDWSARVRLIKAYVKVFAMQTAVSILFTVCIVAQMFIIVGKDWSKITVPKDGDL